MASVTEWDGLEDCLDQNAWAWVEANAGSDPPVSPADYWLLRKANSMTASIIPYPTDWRGNVFDREPNE